MKINAECCIGCGACVQDCPRHILQLENGKAVYYDNRCIQCGHCYCICPVHAVSFTDPLYDAPEEPVLETWPAPEILLRAIRSRRSVRRFQDRRIEEEKLHRILEAIRYTPTGANRQGTECIVIREQLPEITQECLQLMKAAALHPETADTPLLPGYAAHWSMMEREYRRNGRDLLFFHASAVLVLTGGDTIDASLAASRAELMAAAEGLGSVFVGFCRYVLHTPQMRAHLGIPEGREEICTLAIGYPAVRYLRTAPRKPLQVRYL